MSGYHLVISPAARDDLQTIYRFGLRNWGQVQSTRYLENLKKRLWHLTKQPMMGVERPDLLPDTRSLAVESHVIFYRFQSKRIEVIRILHGRQDSLEVRHTQSDDP